LTLECFTTMCQAISVFQGWRFVLTNAPNTANLNHFYLLFDDGVSSSINLTVTAGFDFEHGWSWTPHSADLNPCDYFFQGLLKGKVYKYNHHPHLVEELKAEFTVAVEMSFKKQRQQLWIIA